MPSFLQAAIVRATPRGLRARTAPDAFCLIEHACHLRDLEREGYAPRLARMLEESTPSLAGFEGDVVARSRNYMAQDALAAAREFAALRGRFLERARRLDAGAMRRTGDFMGRSITVCDLLAMMVEHDAGHRREIAQLVAAR